MPFSFPDRCLLDRDLGGTGFSRCLEFDILWHSAPSPQSERLPVGRLGSTGFSLYVDLCFEHSLAIGQALEFGHLSARVAQVSRPVSAVERVSRPVLVHNLAALGSTGFSLCKPGH
jgi:hypothetical protein